MSHSQFHSTRLILRNLHANSLMIKSYDYWQDQSQLTTTKKQTKTKTHAYNNINRKMDGTQASHLYSAVGTSATFRRVGGRGGRDAAFGASQGKTKYECPQLSLLIITSVPETNGK